MSVSGIMKAADIDANGFGSAMLVAVGSRRRRTVRAGLVPGVEIYRFRVHGG
jgi:hypothetical protein